MHISLPSSENNSSYASVKALKQGKCQRVEGIGVRENDRERKREKERGSNGEEERVGEREPGGGWDSARTRKLLQVIAERSHLKQRQT